MLSECPVVVERRLEILGLVAPSAGSIREVILLLVGVDDLVDERAVVVAPLGLIEGQLARTFGVVIVHGVIGVTYCSTRTLGQEREILPDGQIATQFVGSGLLVPPLRKLHIRVVKAVTSREFAILVQDRKSIRCYVIDPHINVIRAFIGLCVNSNVALKSQRNCRIFRNIRIYVRTEIIARVIDVLSESSDTGRNPVVVSRLNVILSLLIINRNSRKIAHSFTASRNIDTEFFIQRYVAHKYILPIDIGVQFGIAARAQRRKFSIGKFHRLRCRRVGINSLVKKYGPFVSIQIGGTLRGQGKSLLVTHVDLGRTIEASFRGDEHDAVGSAHSINCRGTGVFENTERFDFKGIDVVHRPLDTVNQNQWVAIAGKGTDNPNPGPALPNAVRR